MTVSCVAARGATLRSDVVPPPEASIRRPTTTAASGPRRSPPGLTVCRTTPPWDCLMRVETLAQKTAPVSDYSDDDPVLTKAPQVKFLHILATADRPLGD